MIDRQIQAGEYTRTGQQHPLSGKAACQVIATDWTGEIEQPIVIQPPFSADWTEVACFQVEQPARGIRAAILFGYNLDNRYPASFVLVNHIQLDADRLSWLHPLRSILRVQELFQIEMVVQAAAYVIGKFLRSRCCTIKGDSFP